MAIKKRKIEPKPREEVKKQESSEEEEEEVEEEKVEEEKVEEEKEGEDEEEEEEESSSSAETSSNEEEEEDEDESSEEDDDESTKREKLRKLLEPFGKDQIISILKDAALTDPNIFSRITQLADSDPTHRNIFVRGLSWDATQDQFQQAFQPFGEIETCKLMTERDTGRVKGYGFVTFKTRSAAKKALKNPQKTIGSRIVTCQLAALGNTGTGNASDASNRKIFVANVVQAISPEKLRAFFGTFGEIEEGPIGLDPVTKKPRGFAVFVYKSEDGLKKALLEPLKSFEGYQLSCRKFLEGQNINNKNLIVNAVGGSNQKQGNIGNVMTVNPNPGLFAAPDVSTANPGLFAAPNVSTANPGLFAAPNASTANPGLFAAPNVSTGGVLMPQPPGVGLVGNPMLASNFNQAGFGGSGVMGAMAGSYGINSISPSVIGSYGYGIQAALQGLGAYQNQNGQVGQSSTVGTVRAPAPAAVPGAAKTPSVAASSGILFPSYSSY